MSKKESSSLKEPISLTTEMTPKIDDEGTAFSLRNRDYKDPQCIVYGISPDGSNAMKSNNPHSGIYEATTSRTLDLNGGNPACNQGGMAIVCLEGNGQRESHKGDGWKESDTMYTLNTVEQHAICYRGDSITSPVNASNPKEGAPCHTLTDDSRNYVVLENHPADSRVKIAEDGMVQTLSSRMGTGGGNTPMLLESHPQDSRCRIIGEGNVNQPLSANMEHDPSNGGLVMDTVVRRLTPLECTRLQGFPDGWVDIGDWVDSKGKLHKESDSVKYKALGNSIALPFWDWMAERMVKYLDNPTMASLFDGIGGFPLAFQNHGCKPVWASEIEEFPIAVTKIRFSEEEQNEGSMQ